MRFHSKEFREQRYLKVFSLKISELIEAWISKKAMQSSINTSKAIGSPALLKKKVKEKALTISRSMTTFVSDILYVFSRLSRFRSRSGEKQCKCRRHCAVHRAANYSAVFREGDDSSVTLIYTHTYRKSERGWYRRGRGWRRSQRDAEESRRDVLSVNPSPRPFLLPHGRWWAFYLALLYRAPLVRVGGSRHSRTFDFKRYPFSFYYLPSSSAHHATPTDDARIILVRATLQWVGHIAPRRRDSVMETRT